MADMTNVRTWEEVVCCVAEARDKGRMLSNFFPDEKRMKRWCDSGSFSYVELGESIFLKRRQESFSNIYFLSSSVEALAKDAALLISGNNSTRMVVDVLGRDAMREPVEGVFKSIGFSTLTTLQRMSRRTPNAQYSAEIGIEVASQYDAHAIHRLLTDNFIAEEEQIPCLEEIEDWIAEQSILVARGDDDIKGFVIFDLSPAALYLRYWFVSPTARGNGVGGKLMRSMFAAGMGTRRQYFWVKTNNENAIKRYRHYGFEFEPLKDVVMAYCRCEGYC